MQRLNRLNRGAIPVTVGLFLILALTSATGGQHAVVPGDTLWQIAYVHRVPVADLATLNQIANPELIVPGQVLQIPPVAEVQAPPPASGASILHLVTPAETLGEIALRYNVSVEELQSANGLKDSNLITPGQQIVIPAKEGVAAIAPAASQPPSSPEIEAIIDQMSEEYGVDPKLVRALAWVESGWQQGVVSSTGAVGVMQLMPSTSKWLEEEVFRQPLNEDVSVYDNIKAGTLLLRALLDLTGDTDLALAAYYQGYTPTAAGTLYEETKNYVRIVRAVKDRFWP